MYVTPCVGICSIDEETKLCKGCQRSIDEIQKWTSMTYEQKMDVMKRLGYGIRMTREERLRRYDRG